MIDLCPECRGFDDHTSWCSLGSGRIEQAAPPPAERAEVTPTAIDPDKWARLVAKVEAPETTVLAVMPDAKDAASPEDCIICRLFGSRSKHPGAASPEGDDGTPRADGAVWDKLRALEAERDELQRLLVAQNKRASWAEQQRREATERAEKAEAERDGYRKTVARMLDEKFVFQAKLDAVALLPGKWRERARYLRSIGFRDDVRAAGALETRATELDSALATGDAAEIERGEKGPDDGG